MDTAFVVIDEVAIDAEAGASILEAALAAGVYIPHLCSHPDLPPYDAIPPVRAVYRGSRRIEAVDGPGGENPYDGCGLCVVEVEGEDNPVRACRTPVKEGMRIRTRSAALVVLRRTHLAAILETHPHACLTCAQREGCSLTQCSSNVPVEERCCWKFNRCELRKVAGSVGIPPHLPRYRYRDLPRLNDTPLFSRDDNLCIGCMRCVRACHHTYGEAAIGYIRSDDGIVVGALGPSPPESGCRLCGICVEVCPTGALMDTDIQWASRRSDLVPCVHHCPLGLDVPEYVRRIAGGDFAGAAEVIRAGTPLAAVLGRVCFHPCEDVCRRDRITDPVTICALKRFAVEQGDEEHHEERMQAVPSGKRVAVIGSGPAGLAAADSLAGRGHAVTLFEEMEEPGGMLRFGIPGYRLPRDLLSREIDRIVSNELIEVRTNTRVGKAIGLDRLLEDGYDAVLIATGNPLGKALRVEGIDSAGVRQGIDFLREVARGDLSGRPFDGKRVVVIGGGDVAVDAARTAARLGARSVDLVCLERRDEMPAHGTEIASAEAEGIRIHPSLGPARILSDGDQVKGIEVKPCTAVFDDQGRFNPTFDESTRKTFEADEAIVAIGQVPDFSFLGESYGDLKGGQRLVVAGDTMETKARGIFAAGDIVSGPSFVAQAIASGKRAASAIDRFLGGGGIAAAEAIRRSGAVLSGRIEGFAVWQRVPVPCLDPIDRLDGFREVEGRYDPESAMKEARRCLECDLRFRFRGTVLPPEEYLAFHETVIDTMPEVEGVFRLLDGEKEIICIVGTPNLRRALREKLRTDTRARYFHFEPDPMYTKRESELIQQYLQEHGRMPGGGEDALDDLF